jgi:nitric oxide reductase subunit C
MKERRRVGISRWLLGGALSLLVFSGAGHAQEETELLPNIENGKRIVTEEIDCLSCHAINGKGGSVGPDLTQVAIRRSKDWLYDFLFNPETVVPDTKMPRFDLDDQALTDVVGFLTSLMKPVDSEKILSENKDPAKAGEKLVQAYDCRACHRIKNGGLARYPDLTHQGTKVNRNWEWVWLRDPQKIKPGTYMPTFGFDEREIEAITAYIETLRCKAIEESRSAAC